MKEEILKQIDAKYEALGENSSAYLEGLVHAKPITYWDYVQLETLLSLQRPRTDFPDEEIFIMYHQIIELTLKLTLHELKQLTADPQPSAEQFVIKLDRMMRYTDMLITSFDVMMHGMDYDQYNQFRMTLTPASGFQSPQFRYIELHCTRPENLINERGKARLPENPSLEDLFDNMYWKDAGLNRETGKKTLTLRQMEAKYLDSFMAIAKNMQGKTLEERIMKWPGGLPDSVKESLRAFDVKYNIDWPMVHLKTARYFLNSKGENKAATGGSEWQKYLHPMYQQRKFFPELWSEEEKANWAKDRS